MHTEVVHLLFAGCLLCAAAWPLPEALSPHGGPWRSVGNHRYQVSVPLDAPVRSAYVVTLKWRRADSQPASRGTVLLDAFTERPVAKCRRLLATQEEGRFAFSGHPGGLYHIYYMPFQTCEFHGGSCRFGQVDAKEAMVQYEAFNSSCEDEAWWQNNVTDVFAVSAGEQQSRTEFDTFGPMEQAATAEETEVLLREFNGLVTVMEDRGRPVRMSDHVPLSWVGKSKGELTSLRGTAQPGELYSFQVAMLANESFTIEEANLTSPAFKHPGDASGSISPQALRCLNLQGVDYWGRSFNSTLHVKAAEVAVLWFVLDIADSTPAGNYTGSLKIKTSVGFKTLVMSVQVSGPKVVNHGHDDLWRGTRLAWLDSTLGNNDDIPSPFTPLSVNGMSVSMLDKVFKISANGLLESVQVGNVEALASGMRLEILQKGGSTVALPMIVTVGSATNLTVPWEAKGSATGVSVQLTGTLDGTGYADVRISVAAASEHEVRLVLPMMPSNSKYAAGLGRSGGFLRRWFNSSEPTTWKWDGVNGNNGVWIGSTKAGLRLFPKGDDPFWQAAVPNDSDKAPPTPQSWSNNGSGGIRVESNGTITAFTGLRPAGNETYLFSVMATPTRPLNLQKHFQERYAQVGEYPVNFTHLRQGGATVVNIHQGNALNPWINYPYLTSDLLKEAADECRRLGMKLKVYNTMRELSNHAQELWALRALNETLVWRGGDGGGGDWLREHLRGNYSVAWSSPLAQSGFWSQEIDMAVRVTAMSRWNNYYVEGLKQIVREFSCDGIYLDEIAYDRVTMRRAKAVLGPAGLIDHHSDHGQFAKCPAVVYMEHFPFIDSLWYGEGFDYDHATPDFWLVEISGIPFGLPSDMLRYAGMTPFHFRGMLFASSNRWQDNINPTSGPASPFDPRDIWALWNSFSIGSSTMYGWWLAEEGGSVPVVTNSTDVLCTVYKNSGKALLALANFGSEQPVILKYDWKQLGLNPDHMRLRAPALQPMQPVETIWALDQSIRVPAPQHGSATSREGWLILIEPHPKADPSEAFI